MSQIVERAVVASANIRWACAGGIAERGCVGEKGCAGPLDLLAKVPLRSRSKAKYSALHESVGRRNNSSDNYGRSDDGLRRD